MYDVSFNTDWYKPNIDTPYKNVPKNQSFQSNFALRDINKTKKAIKEYYYIYSFSLVDAYCERMGGFQLPTTLRHPNLKSQFRPKAQDRQE